MRLALFASRPLAFFSSSLFVLVVATLPRCSRATVVTLSNGDVLNAEVIEKGPTEIVLQHAVLGTLKIPRTAVASIAEPSSEVVRKMAPEVTVPAITNTNIGLLGIGLLRGWTRKLEVGVTGVEGNNHNQKLRVGFTGAYEDDRHRWAIDSIYAYNRSEGETSENDFFAELTRDWLRPGSPWFNFANARYDWDEFNDWDHRIAGSGGVGYQFSNTDTWALAGRFGLGANQTIGGEPDEFTLEASLGADGRWQIASGQVLKFRNTYYQSLEQLREFRNISGVDWEIQMATDVDLSVKIGFANEYDSKTDDDDDTNKNNFKYYGGVVWGF